MTRSADNGGGVTWLRQLIRSTMARCYLAPTMIRVTFRSRSGSSSVDGPRFYKN
ncbi:hypothetical protein HanRHA438_Chr12g0544771 [Helianthus annuus]|nr:hypothetical protein HanRHA438_Chr12g0544771 [Helianthus annuus]